MPLLITAAFIGFFHTLVGVDHYIPFVALSKANNWSLQKTNFIVFICGIGHILGSVLLGMIGIALGTALTTLTGIENWRGDLAVWFLIAFGLVYSLIGLRRAYKKKPHSHFSPEGGVFEHKHSEFEHIHEHEGHIHFHRAHGEHDHEENRRGGSSINTFWMLFILFVLGPCEPLIPILMYPAAQADITLLIGVTVVFSAVTIGTMIAATTIVLKGVSLLPLKNLDRYSHVLAGCSIFLCGVAIMVFDI